MRLWSSDLIIWILIFLTSPELNVMGVAEHSCPSAWFDCGNGRCVAPFFVCDGDDDCDNQQDEMDCPSKEDSTCERHQFKCKDSGHCIPAIWKCDGHADCTDLSDESDCSKNVSCGGGYLCPGNKCIPISWRCDGQWDCEGGLDETDCDKMKRQCTEHEFKCNDSTCISLAKACDFKKDCKNGEDEGSHCVEKACQNMTCAHECFLTPAGPECACRAGHKLDKDQKSCLDINECSINPGPCSQNCFNTKGSYSCSCKAGYNLVNKTICSVSGASPLLLFATSHEIRGIWTRPKEFFRVASTRNTAIGVSYDSLQNRVYWIESRNKGGAVMAADIDGKNKKEVLTKGLQEPQDIVVDYIARNLYITDQKLQQVLVCKMDGTVCAAVLTGEKPRGLAICHRDELLFWSDWGETKSGIYRSEMDGRNNSVFVKKDVFWPNGLSLDFSTDRLYWCEAKLERIEYITLDGKERRIVLEAARLHPYYVAVFEDTLYYSDWNKYSLESCNKRTGKNQTTIVRGERKRVTGVHVFHPIDYANERNPCWDESCSHLCLISRKSYGYACACPTGYELDSDKSTCIPFRNTSFLLAAEENLIFHVHPEAVGENIVTQLPTKRLYKIGDMAFDWSTQTLYISDLDKQAIFKMDTSSYSVSVFVQKGVDTVKGLDYDWIGNNLYWTDAGTGTVQVITRDGGTRTTIVDGLSRPLDIVVCPDKGVMFIAESSTDSKIIICHMDGQNCRTLVDHNLGTPVSLSVNLWASRLMWADPKNSVIESTDLKGSNRVKNFRHKGPVMSVSYSRDFIFWTDLNSHGVRYARTEDDSVQGFINLPHEHNETEVIKVAYFSAPPDQRGSVCSIRNGGCSHMCLTNPLGYVCACGSKMELSKNSHTCQNQTTPGCRSGEFLCGSGECIQNEFVCDGRNDCLDISDENATTCHTGCSSDEFQCANGFCIVAKWRCDGSKDCKDNSDEKDCPKPATCGEDEFLCVKEAKCIPKIWVCDGDGDCLDKSDEGPDCKDVTCGPTETRCKDGNCAPTIWFCDGERDCKDGSDEDESLCKAVRTCKSDEFTCGNGFCLDKALVCDRRQDCPDGSDENNCPKPTGDCRSEEYKCPEDLCINNRSLCDGYEDCEHGEDEKNCETTILDCKSFEFQCKTDKCISRTALCDGVNDCGDNEDETHPKCLKMFTKSPVTPMAECPEFKCDYGKCIPWSQVCDGNEDCYDLSDEGRRCGASCSHENGGCVHNCRDTPVGAVCSCKEGFELMQDGKACQDVNECLTPGHCSQLCANKKGGYKCTCVEGYHISDDGKRCKATGEREILMVQTFDSIRELSLYGGQHLVQGTGTDIRGMDFDADDDAVFWTETSNGVINSLTNKNAFAVISKNLNQPTLLAYDWIGRNFYFTSVSNVDVCRRDGKFCGHVLDMEHEAHSFAVNPVEGLMFWSVWSELTKSGSGIIARANMDGSEKSVIASNKVSWPSGLTVDIVMSKLYWTDLRLSTIEMSDFDGYNRKILINIGLQHPQSMTLFEDNLYWSNWGSRQIVRGNKFTGGSQVTMQWDDIRAYGLKMVHKVLQPKPHDPCSKAQCDQLCLLRSNGYKCVCGYGYRLDSNSTCVSEMVDKKETKNITVATICPNSYCFNGGLCSMEEDGPYCSCLVSYHGVRCEYIVKSAHVQESDLTWVAGVVLGLLLVTLVVVGVFLLWRRHGQRLRGAFGDGMTVSFKNQLFSRGGEMDLDQNSQETQSGEEISMGKDGAYNSDKDKPKLTEEGGIYRWPSSESVGDKDNRGLLSGKKSSQPEAFRRFFQRN